MSNTTSEILRIAGFENDSITDGPGLRFALFVQGCPRVCPGCHNPESIPVEGGTEWTVDAIYAMIRRNPLLTGVTFSGGEPLLQPIPLTTLARRVRADRLDLAIYTGYIFEELLKTADSAVMDLLSQGDILIDGPYLKQQRNLSLRFKGSENQRILDLPRSLAAGRAVLTDDTDWTG